MSTFVFLHVDRTGGMSLREQVAAQFRADEVRPVPHHTGASVDIRNYRVDRDANLYRQHAAFTHMANHRLVMGHWDAGVLGRIPGEKRVMTVLREPVARALSLWRFIVKEQAMFGAMSVEARQQGAVEFLLRNEGIWANRMVAQMAGIRWSYPGRVVGDEHLAKAKDIMNRFDYVGVTERLDLFAEAVGQREGWDLRLREINWTVQNEFQTDTQEQRLLGERCKLDTQLYRFARAKCEQLLQSSLLGT